MTKQKPTLNQADIDLLKLSFASKDDLSNLEDKIRLLPTRDEFLTKMAEVMRELQNIHPDNKHQFALASNR